MQALLCGDWGGDEARAWRDALRALDPAPGWWIDGEPLPPGVREAVEVAVVANPPPGRLQGLPRLRLVQSLWAGVDRLLADPTLPAGVPLARMVDPAMNTAMAETAQWAVLALQRDFFRYAAQQREARWQVWPQRRAADWRVTVLGLGQMGAAVARRLLAQGHPVQAWRQRPGAGPVPEGVVVAHGRDGLAALLAQTDTLVNLLPLTDDTRGLIDAGLLARLPRGASLVNLARGAHVVEADLLAALDRGQLAHAVLDVFASEPLAAEHPFWRHPAVTVLPHAAAQTDARSAARVVVAQLQALRDGRPLAHVVDRRLGY